MSTTMRRRVGASSAAAIVLLCTVGTLGAQAADQTIDLPLGIACPDFPLRIEITSNEHRVVKEFRDEDNNVVLIIESGRADDYLLTNMTTGKTMFLNGKGSAAQTTINPDGSTTVENNGYTGVVLFPNDVPLPGGIAPSTTLYTGRVVYTIGADGIYRVESAAGRTVDVCAALS